MTMTSTTTVTASIAVVLLTFLCAAPPGIEGARCSAKDITVVQSQGPPQYNGIPTYIVEILNGSPKGVSISDIHLKCGWFSSARLVNPKIFKRLRHDDCLVNGGKPLPAGYAVSFTYATTFQYPLSVSSIKC